VLTLAYRLHPFSPQSRLRTFARSQPGLGTERRN